MLAVALPERGRARAARDRLPGTALLAVGLASLVLLTTLGGTTYDWSSAADRRPRACSASRPSPRSSSSSAAPPSRSCRRALFRNASFRVTSAIGLVVGFALFGSLTYLPLFQQVVRGLSPTESGLQLMPLMVGLLGASIVSAR